MPWSVDRPCFLSMGSVTSFRPQARALLNFILVPIINVNIITVIQGTTPSEIRGRVFGLVSTLALGLIPIAQGLSGFAIDAIDQKVSTIYIVAGPLTTLLICISLISPAPTKSGHPVPGAPASSMLLQMTRTRQCFDMVFDRVSAGTRYLLYFCNSHPATFTA